MNPVLCTGRDGRCMARKCDGGIRDRRSRV